MATVDASPRDILAALKRSGAFDRLLSECLHHLMRTESNSNLVSQSQSSQASSNEADPLAINLALRSKSFSVLRGREEQLARASANIMSSGNNAIGALDLQAKLKQLQMDRTKVTEQLFTEALPALHAQLEERVAVLLRDADEDSVLDPQEAEQGKEEDSKDNGHVGTDRASASSSSSSEVAPEARLRQGVRTAVENVIDELFRRIETGDKSGVAELLGRASYGTNGTQSGVDANFDVAEMERRKRAEIAAAEHQRRQELEAQKQEAERVRREVEAFAQRQREQETAAEAQRKLDVENARLAAAAIADPSDSDDSSSSSDSSSDSSDSDSSSSGSGAAGQVVSMTEGTAEQEHDRSHKSADFGSSRKRNGDNIPRGSKGKRPRLETTSDSQESTEQLGLFAEPVDADLEDATEPYNDNRAKRSAGEDEHDDDSDEEEDGPQLHSRAQLPPEETHPGLFASELNSADNLLQHCGPLRRSLLHHRIRFRTKQAVVVKVDEDGTEAPNSSKEIIVRCLCDTCSGMSDFTLIDFAEHASISLNKSLAQTIAVSTERDFLLLSSTLPPAAGRPAKYQFQRLQAHWSNVQQLFLHSGQPQQVPLHELRRTADQHE